jgi:hypothetical protein
MKRDTDDIEKVYFRTDRFHHSGGYWYFLTREGEDVGPFNSRERAEAELTNYLGVKPPPPVT